MAFGGQVAVECGGTVPMWQRPGGTWPVVRKKRDVEAFDGGSGSRVLG